MKWQDHLGATIHKLFPEKNILTNVRKNAQIFHPSSGKYLELDFWIPDLKLAFEYQDPHHYTSTWYSNASTKDVQKRDNFKKEVLDERGETLVIVPCWWDGTQESLIATIRLQRKELFSDWKITVPPVSPVPPIGYFEENEIKGVGQLMLASFATNSTNDEEIKSWWLSEKYDGIRACWSPVDHSLYTRVGKVINIEKKLTSLFPSIFLDGELWFGKGSFQATFTLIDGLPSAKDMLRMIVFDCPSSVFSDLPFEERYEKLLSNISLDHPSLINAANKECLNTKHIQKVTKTIFETGGEGIVAREPKSTYHQGRSESLIKFKAQRDQEGLVIGVEDDGSYLIQLPDGTSSIVPLAPDKELTRLPYVGDVITIVFAGYNRFTGNLQGARIHSLRPDMTWRDVLMTWRGYGQTSITNVSLRALATQTPKFQIGYWTQNESEKVREFFDNFAASRKFDPLVNSNWYEIRRQDVLEAGGSKALNQYGRSLITSLIQTYPEVSFDETAFLFTKQKFWTDRNKRRDYFIMFAKKRNFDPLIPQNWYAISQKTLCEEQKSASLLGYYNNSYTDALLDLFPNIGIDPTKFTKIKQGYWNEVINRRDFFNNFAAKRKFDPLDPENWYFITKRQIIAEKGGKRVLDMYRNSVQLALLSLYPDIGLQKMKFNKVLRGHWQDKQNHKVFFDNLASKLGIDPLCPDHWYDNVNNDVIIKEKGGCSILNFHKTLFNAISEAYPNIGLQSQNFNRPVWTETARRKFFDEFARKHDFDPLIPTNWYKFTTGDILQEKGGKVVLDCYNRSLVVTLLSLYPEIGLDQSQFYALRMKKNFWSKEENLKTFFERLAAKLGFNPKEEPEKWYSIKRKDIGYEKGGTTILNHFEGSLSAAVLSVYPNLIPSKFKFGYLHKWGKVEQKQMFDSIAISKGFDPLTPSNWYSVQAKDIFNRKGGATVLAFYGSSIPLALENIYNLKLDHSQFK